VLSRMDGNVLTAMDLQLMPNSTAVAQNGWDVSFWLENAQTPGILYFITITIKTTMSRTISRSGFIAVVPATQLG
jgi:hypothetical protein